MSELDQAQARLDAAVARLSAALSGERGTNAAASVELKRLTDEHAALMDVTRRVARGLDKVIEKLGGLVDEPAGAE